MIGYRDHLQSDSDVLSGMLNANYLDPVLLVRHLSQTVARELLALSHDYIHLFVCLSVSLLPAATVNLHSV